MPLERPPLGRPPLERLPLERPPSERLPPERLLAAVPAGGELAFARALRRTEHWPPSRIARDYRDVPPATPYIVVPANPNDLGGRPFAGTEAVHCGAIEVIDAGGYPIDNPVAGTAYTLRATIRNRGAAACYAGVVEFTVADPVVVEAANDSVGAPSFAIEGFVASSGATVVVTCRRSWIPANAAEAGGSIVVHAYDALLDRPTHRFDSRADRHVGRRDLIPDFSGTWDGRQHLAGGTPGAGFLYRVVVTQAGVKATVSIFEQVSATDARQPLGRGPVVLPTGGVRLIGSGRPTPMLPATPQLTGTGTIANGQLQLSLVGFNFEPPIPFTTDDVMLTLPNPDTMHVVQHEAFVDPADPRGPMTFVADLTRAQ